MRAQFGVLHAFCESFFCVLRLNALNCFECLNWQGLIAHAIDKLP